MHKNILFAVFVLYGIHCCSQQTRIECFPIENAVQTIRDSLQNVYVLVDIEPFSITSYHTFREKFSGVVSNKVLRKAFSMSKSKRQFVLKKCLSEGILLSKQTADSLRARSKLMLGVEKSLYDSVNKELNDIFSLHDKSERETKYDSLQATEAYKRLKIQTAGATSRLILVGMPVFVMDQYVFFTLYLSDTGRDFRSYIYLYKKEAANWVLLKVDDW